MQLRPVKEKKSQDKMALQGAKVEQEKTHSSLATTKGLTNGDFSPKLPL